MGMMDLLGDDEDVEGTCGRHGELLNLTPSLSYRFRSLKGGLSFKLT